MALSRRRGLHYILSEEYCKKVLLAELFFIPIVAVVIIASGGLRPADGAADNAPLSDKRASEGLASAVVRVNVYDEKTGRRGYGTGFFVNSKGQLITCYHVIDKGALMTINTADGCNYAVTEILATDKYSDLALLQADVKPANVTFLEITDDVPAFANEVRVIGYPGREPLRVSSGRVDSAGELSNICRTFQISAPVAPGSSGSPVFDETGKVIGVAKAMKPYPIDFPETYVTPVSRFYDVVLRREAMGFGEIHIDNALTTVAPSVEDATDHARRPH